MRTDKPTTQWGIEVGLAMVRDAERYRWLRSRPTTILGLAMLSDDALDAAIDAAMNDTAPFAALDQSKEKP